jgi:hypothetical protein
MRARDYARLQSAIVNEFTPDTCCCFSYLLLFFAREDKVIQFKNGGRHEDYYFGSVLCGINDS